MSTKRAKSSTFPDIVQSVVDKCQNSLSTIVLNQHFKKIFQCCLSTQLALTPAPSLISNDTMQHVSCYILHVWCCRTAALLKCQMLLAFMVLDNSTLWCSICSSNRARQRSSRFQIKNLLLFRNKIMLQTLLFHVTQSYLNAWYK